MIENQNDNDRMKWFVQDRFGMFIHWGLYAIPARGEWVRSVEKISNEDYEPYFDEFDPVDYDPQKWARLAKNAGMKYAVLTAKHHDGFCLFDSKLTDYKATNTRAKRDLVKEYVEAFRAEGLKVGLYYSLLDWHHPDYPHYNHPHHPMRENESWKGAVHNFDNYLAYMHGQVEELCTNYGKIDIFWFDFSYDEMTGEKWRATELINMIRSHQPHVIIDNRLDASGDSYGSLAGGTPKPYAGDFVSPEQVIPVKGVVDKNGNPLIWEACITMNNNWGYTQADRNFKPAHMLIKKLVECVSKGGNLLLNVGPDAKGNIPDESEQILCTFARWMAKNSKSIYNCTKSEIEKPEYGRITQNGSFLYYHVTEAMVGYICLTGIPKERIKKIRLLATGAALPITNDWNLGEYPEAFVSLGGNPVLPDEIDTVIEVEIREEKSC